MTERFRYAPIGLAVCFALCASGAFAENEHGDRHTESPIKHVIVLIGENQTFDNVYATYVPFASGSASLARASPT